MDRASEVKKKVRTAMLQVAVAKLCTKQVDSVGSQRCRLLTRTLQGSQFFGVEWGNLKGGKA